MFSYSYYGTKCANFLFGAKNANYYTYFYLAMLIVFAVVPLSFAVSICDLFYAFMAFPTMIMLLILSPRVKKAAKDYFANTEQK